MKCGVWDDEGKIIFHEVTCKIPYETIGELKRLHDVDKVIVCSVKGSEEAVRKELEKYAGNGTVIFDMNEISCYRDRIDYSSGIGADRIAAFLGAERIYPGTAKLIIDAGTAITLDVADEDGVFRGGDISLGLTGRLNALHSGTALLPNIEVKGVDSPFGHDTESAILNGALYGILGEMIFAIERARKYYNIERTILTGGDGAIFTHMLKEHGYECAYDALLVEKGLDCHLRA